METEIYILSDSRTKEEAFHFLNSFDAVRTPVCDEYEVPEFVDEPTDVFYTEEDILNYLSNNSESYSIYWSISGINGVSQVMLFFTVDGGLIKGLAGENSSIIKIADQYKSKGHHVLMSSMEMPPPDSISEFKAYLEKN